MRYVKSGLKIGLKIVGYNNENIKNGMNQICTNKDNKFTISHNKYDNYSYVGGEFGVNLNLNNLDLSKGFILEFKKIKDKI